MFRQFVPPPVLRLLRLIPDSRFTIILSVPLVLEYEEVLKRTDLSIPLRPERIDDILNFLCRVGSLRKIRYLWRPALSDPDDDFLLELAVESSCDFIVTYNTRDFIQGASGFGIKAIKPIEFLKVIGEIK